MSALATHLLWRVFSLAVSIVVVVAVRDDLRDQVEFSESLTTLQTASCIVEKTEKSLHAVDLKQTVNGSSRLLEKMNVGCPTPPCIQQRLGLPASRGSLEEHTTSKLTLAWEASASLDIDEDEFTCKVFFGGDIDGQELTVSVRSFPARKLRWRVNKTRAGLPTDSSLEIRLKDGVKGWKLLGREAGVHVNVFRFDSLGTEDGGVTLVKVVNSPNIYALTLLHTQSSDLEWECSMREGDFERPCGTSAIRNQEAQEAQEAQWTSKHTTLLVGVVAVLAIVTVAVLIVFLCRMKKQLNLNSIDSGTNLAASTNDDDNIANEVKIALTICHDDD